MYTAHYECLCLVAYCRYTQVQSSKLQSQIRKVRDGQLRCTHRSLSGGVLRQRGGGGGSGATGITQGSTLPGRKAGEDYVDNRQVGEGGGVGVEAETEEG